MLLEAAPEEHLYEGILYTTLEPCAMCLGAAVVSGVRHIRYAAEDGPTDARRLLLAHPLLASKNVALEGPEPLLGAFSLVLMSDWILREASDTAERTLSAYRVRVPGPVELAQRWHRGGLLQRMAQEGAPLDDVLGAVQAALGSVRR